MHAVCLGGVQYSLEHFILHHDGDKLPGEHPLIICTSFTYIGSASQICMLICHQDTMLPLRSVDAGVNHLMLRTGKRASDGDLEHAVVNAGGAKELTLALAEIQKPTRHHGEAQQGIKVAQILVDVLPMPRSVSLATAPGNAPTSAAAPSYEVLARQTLECLGLPQTADAVAHQQQDLSKLMQSLLQKDSAIIKASALDPATPSRDLCGLNRTYQAAAAASFKHLAAVEGSSNTFTSVLVSRLQHILPAWQSPEVEVWECMSAAAVQAPKAIRLLDQQDHASCASSKLQLLTIVHRLVIGHLSDQAVDVNLLLSSGLQTVLKQWHSFSDEHQVLNELACAMLHRLSVAAASCERGGDGKPTSRQPWFESGQPVVLHQPRIPCKWILCASWISCVSVQSACILIS